MRFDLQPAVFTVEDKDGKTVITEVEKEVMLMYTIRIF